MTNKNNHGGARYHPPGTEGGRPKGPETEPITLRIPSKLRKKLKQIVPRGKLTAWIIQAVIEKLNREQKR